MTFLTFIIGALLGIVGGVFLARWIARNRKDVAHRLGLSTRATWLPAPGEKPPAVDPEKMPDTLTAEDVKQGAAKKLPHPDLQELIERIIHWQPKRHRSERKFHESFEDFLLEQGYDYDDYQHEHRISWCLDDGSESRYARPDFIIRDEVLVEIKRNITVSGTTDRALGQMLRYLMAWRSKGPAVLVVCNDYDENLRQFVQRSVRSWKAQGVPVMAYFVRSADDKAALDDVPFQEE